MTNIFLSNVLAIAEDNYVNCVQEGESGRSRAVRSAKSEKKVKPTEALVAPNKPPRELGRVAKPKVSGGGFGGGKPKTPSKQKAAGLAALGF